MMVASLEGFYMYTIRLFVVLGLFALCTFNIAFAQDFFDKKAIKGQLNVQKIDIDSVEFILTERNFDGAQILKIRQNIRETISEIKRITTIIRPAYEDVTADIVDLGPLSEDISNISEPKSIQKQRASLTEKSLMIEGLLKQADALNSKSNRLLEKVASLRRVQFLNQLFETQTSPFNAPLWSSALEAYTAQLSSYKNLISLETSSQVSSLIFSCFLFIILFLVSSIWSEKYIQKKYKNFENCSPFSAVSLSLVMPLLASAIGLFIIFQTLHAQEIINEVNNLLIYNFFGLIVFLFFVFWGSRRLVKAHIIRSGTNVLAILVAVLFAVDTVSLEAGKIMGMPLELMIAQSYVVSSIFAVLLGVCSYRVIKTPTSQVGYFLPKQFFIVFLGISLFLITANIFGYAALSHYLFERTVLLLSVLVFVLVARAIAAPYLHRIDKILTQNKNEYEVELPAENFVFFWLSLTLDVVLFLIVLPVFARVIGAEWASIQDWATHAFFGFKIGTMTISIANIGVAILVFLAFLFATRLVQRVMGQKILPKTKMEGSIRQSIIQIMGYVGLIIALMVGVSAAGFDLSNLALIAGALSVGIGFGLQSIVSNFVSGLILLFERPIKIGDWIITASGEGIVKKISVRATEIETFDRTSIIVPNSELISSSVKNWTHTDKIGRAIVAVGVSYDSDPQQVHGILLKCAKDNIFSLKNPEPNVIFKDFADSALLFELRFFIKNIGDVHKASTAMRFEIWDALKKKNIEISFPQRDLHIRSADGLKGLIHAK
jgi:potassium efflux system protein